MKKDEVLKTYSANFRNKLSAKGCTQADFAGLLGVSSGSVSVWSRGTCFPSIETAMDIADLLGTTVSEMLGEVDASTYENSKRYHISDEIWGRKPVIDKEELEAMELLHKRGIIDDEKYYGYITEKLKEIAE